MTIASEERQPALAAEDEYPPPVTQVHLKSSVAAAESQPLPTVDEVMSSFAEPDSQPDVAVAYRLGLVVVAVTMTVLFLAYAVLVVCTFGMSISLLADAFAKAATADSPRDVLFDTIRGALLAIVFIFMVRPFLNLFEKKPEPYAVTAADEPALFEFVERICSIVNAPLPSQIYLTADVNASVSCRRGLRSLFSNDFVLSLGLPLVYGLDLRQLAGVIAHESGYFGQASGRRVTFIVITLSNWFSRVVDHRDAFDDKLVRLSRKAGVFYPIFFVIFIVSGLPRFVLRCLMYIGYLIGSFFLRRMEHDADRDEALISGSTVFETTTWRMALLGAAYELSIGGLNQAFKDGRLGDNLPVLVATNEKLLKVDDRKHLRNAIYKRPPKDDSAFARLMEILFTTHPSDRRRIKSVRKLAFPGLFLLQAPPAVLFQNLQHHGAEVTTRFYKFALQKRFKRDKIVDSGEIVKQLEEMTDACDALDRCFRYAVSFDHPYTIRKPKPEEKRDSDEQIKLLGAAREQMEFCIQSAQAAMKRFDQAQTCRHLANLATAMVRGKVVAEARTLLQMNVGPDAISGMLRDADRELRMVNDIVDSFRKLTTNRFNLAFQLLGYEGFRNKMETGDRDYKHLDDLIKALKQITTCRGDINELAGAAYLCNAIMDSGREPSPRMISFLMSTHDRVEVSLHKVHHYLSEAAYPFRHELGRISIGPYVLETIPERGDYLGLLNAASEMFDKTIGLYYRIIGQIALIVERVEVAAGMDKFPKVPTLEEDLDDDDDDEDSL
jgi:Zn-dependent protease with chaperone function